jgi:hypothetical protein
MTGALGGGLVGATLALASSGSVLTTLYLAAAGVTAGAAFGALLGKLIALRSMPPADPERARWRRVWAAVGVMLYALALPAMANLFTVRFRNRILSALGAAAAAPMLALFVLFISGAMAGALELVVRRLPAERRADVTRVLARVLPALATLEIAALLWRRRTTFSPDTWGGLALVAGWVALVFFGGAWLERRLRRDPPTAAARNALVIGLLVCLGATLQLFSGHAPAAVRASRDRIPLLRVLL